MLIVGGVAGRVGSVGIFVLHLGWWFVAVCAGISGALPGMLEHVRMVEATDGTTA